ncbi:cellulose binding domain-containing protein [Microbispora sp. NBC_01189]|uniref:cellulose binding domain-containing protein n=1 Tax=Microbispora sp. NBC_01189 TaxID=2903583 RepID=UPI002E1402A3|nr:cellulose binding domain-containing protein [Microbispora sp. NBC_01189]
MSKTSAVMAALLVVLGVLVTRPAQAAPVRIMALGDSITGSPGCWRALLWNRLQSNGFTNIDMVGTLPPQGCSVPYDGDNEGHGGALVTNVADQNQLPGWLSATRPDIVLMHFGTNDVWSNKPTATILAAYGTLVDQMRASNPNMRVLVAKIIPMNPGTCPECGQRVADLNNAIPGWAAAKTTAASPIQVVDQWTGFSTSADTYDGVHPNASGDQKMADRWYPALSALLGGAQPSPSASPSASPSRSPSPSPSASPSRSPSPSPSASPSRTPSTGPGGCSATYVVTNQWGGGFQGEITVKNTGTAPISGWTVTWTFANGQQVSQAWNGTLTQSGASVTAKNVGWNGSLTTGATTTLGFLASWNGANSVPSPSCTATP